MEKILGEKSMAKNIILPLASFLGEILTWDNLTKRGFVGPWICHLCPKEGKHMENLLNSYSISISLLDLGGMNFYTMDCNRDSVNKTIVG
jgi:hypothetical protein